MLFGDAQTANNMGKIECAIQKWQEAARIYQQIEDRLRESECYLQVAQIYLMRFDLDNAFNHYLKTFSAASQVYETLIVKDIDYDQAKIAQGNALYEEGKAFFEQKKYAKALEKLAQAQAIYQDIKYGIGELRAMQVQIEIYVAQQEYFAGLSIALRALVIANALPIGTPTFELYISGFNQYKDGNFQKAIDIWENVLKRYIEEKKSINEAITRTNLGNIYALLGRYDDALAQYKLALPVVLKEKDQKNEATILHNQAAIYLQTGYFKEAESAISQALELWQALGELSNIAATWNLLGLLHREKGEMELAISYFQKSLELSQHLHEQAGVADSYNNIGYVYYTQAQYKVALSNFKQALSIWEKLGISFKVANTLSNLASVYTATGQYSVALEHYQTALTLQIDSPPNQAVIKINMGDIELFLGNYSKALDLYKESQGIFQQTPNPLNEGIALSNMGAVYVYLSDLEQAYINLKKARKRFQDAQSQEREAYVLNNLGLIATRQGEFKAALEYFRAALEISPKIGDKLKIGQNLTNLGLVYTNLGEYQTAYELFQKGAVILKNIGASESIWITLLGLASVEFVLNKVDMAMIHYEEALDNIEKLRAGLEEKEQKLSFIRDKLVVYDKYIFLLQHLHNKYPNKGYDHKALEIFERKQGRIFLEEMGKSGARRFAGVPEEISQRDREFELQIATARQSRTQALAQGKDAEPHRKRLEKLQAEQADFEKTLQRGYPAYYALKYPKPVALDKLQKQVLQADELMLIYNVREEASDLWIVGKQHFALFSLPLTEKQIQQQVTAFRDTGIETMLSEIKTAEQIELKGAELTRHLENAVDENLPDFIDASHALYQQLLPKAARDLIALAKPHTLYIVPTRALYSLPFEAIVTEPDEEKPRYLIQDYAIAYLSSASLFKTLRSAKERRNIEDRLPFLAFANPAFPCEKEPDESTIKGLRTRAYRELFGGDCIPELPDTEEEALNIAQLFNVTTYTYPQALYLGEDASREKVLQLHEDEELDEFRYVLFATHAVLPDQLKYIDQPAVLLSYPEEGGYLTMADVFGLQMNADLVTLSACNTGQGENIKGEGVRGLTRAFMYAGTPAVSVSLWEVHSRATQQLNQALFGQLKDKRPLADSLRQAKIAMLEGDVKDEIKEIYFHPYFWAGFVVFGDGE
ncbi:MAG: tetratricopeptide repeat protein [Pseudomonadota bacterium]